MKTKTDIKKKKIEKEFDTVKTFRKIKDKISNDLIGKNKDQIKDYLKINSAKLSD